MSRKNTLNQKRFDAIIKEQLLRSGEPESHFTYCIQEKGKKYYDYYHKDIFAEFVEEMKDKYSQHYLKFRGNPDATANKGGAGGELFPKGMTPPKMASVGSSSRFCYLALRDGTNTLFPHRSVTKSDVEFEKECKIFPSGSAPQLDAYIQDEACATYFEAKCHEIFTKHKATFKKKYWDYLKNDQAFGSILPTHYPGDTYFQIPLNHFGINSDTIRFDIKQCICHLLGIATQNQGKSAKLIYMFFKPTGYDAETAQKIDTLFHELRTEIKAIFSSTVIQTFCKNHHIVLQAIALESNIMTKLDDSTLIYLWP